MSAHPTAERLGAYLDDELDATARAEVDAHLRECTGCAEHLADLAAVDEAARRVPLAVPEGYFDDFAPRVRARLQKRAQVRWRPPVWGWAAAAALVLGVIVPLALRSPRARPGVAMPAPVAADRAGPAAAPLRPEAPRPPTVGADRPASPKAALPAPSSTAPRPAAPQEQDALADRSLSREEIGAAGTAAPGFQEAPPRREQPEPAQATIGEAAKRANEVEGEPIQDKQGGLGYVAPPPPATQRQHGPRSQSTAVAPGDLRLRKTAAESKDQVQTAGETAADSTAEPGAPAAVMQEQVEVSPPPRDVATGRASGKFRSLAAGPPPRSDAEARVLREAWRTFASENPGHPQADEARVRLVEAGALAYTLGRRPQDREVAIRDARAYLERPEAPQAARVRAVLETLAP